MPRAGLPAARGRAALEHRPGWSLGTRRVCAGARRRRRPGWSSARRCPAAASGTCCWSRRWRCRRSSTATRWISLLPGLDTYAGALLVVTLSYFPFVYLPVRGRASAGSTRRWRRPRRGSGLSPLGGLPAGSSCRSCGSPCSAAACWSRCTCWPSSARCRCCATRPSPPRSTTSTAPPSTARGATMLAGVLVLLLPAAAARRDPAARRRRGYARIGRGAARPRRPVRARRGSPCRALVGLRRLVVLALVVPLGSLVYWMVAGASTAFDAARPADDHGDHARRSPRSPPRSTTAAGAAHRLARRPRPRPARHAARAQHLPRQLGARHRRRPGPGHPEHPGHAAGSTRPCRCCSPPT